MLEGECIMQKADSDFCSCAAIRNISAAFEIQLKHSVVLLAKSLSKVCSALQVFDRAAEVVLEWYYVKECHMLQQ